MCSGGICSFPSHLVVGNWTSATNWASSCKRLQNSRKRLQNSRKRMRKSRKHLQRVVRRFAKVLFDLPMPSTKWPLKVANDRCEPWFSSTFIRKVGEFIIRYVRKHSPLILPTISTFDPMARILIIAIWIPFSPMFHVFDILFAFRAHPWFGYPFYGLQCKCPPGGMNTAL